MAEPVRVTLSAMPPRIRQLTLVAALLGLVLLTGCGSSGGPATEAGTGVAGRSTERSPARPRQPRGPGHRVPPLLDPHDIYAADRPGMLSPVVRDFPERVYVPNSESDSVSVVDPHAYKVV